MDTDLFSSHSSLLDGLIEIDRIAEHADALLMTRTPSDLLLANAITRSGLVLLCGYFEGFVRELAQDAVDAVNDLQIDVNKLPASILVELLVQAVSYSGEKRVLELTRIRDNIKERKPCTLDRKRLSSTGGNPTVDAIEGVFATLGVAAVIDTLSIRDFGLESTFTVERQSKSIEGELNKVVADETILEKVLEVVDSRWSPRKKRRSVGYVSAIEELLKRRNRIAHGEGREPVTPRELREYREHIGRLAEGMVVAVRSIVSDLSPADS